MRLRYFNGELEQQDTYGDWIKVPKIKRPEHDNDCTCNDCTLVQFKKYKAKTIGCKKCAGTSCSDFNAVYQNGILAENSGLKAEVGILVSQNVGLQEENEKLKSEAFIRKVENEFLAKAIGLKP